MISGIVDGKPCAKQGDLGKRIGKLITNHTSVNISRDAKKRTHHELQKMGKYKKNMGCRFSLSDIDRFFLNRLYDSGLIS